MDYIELTVSTTTFGAETVSEILMENGAAGTQIIDRNDLPDPDKPGKNWELMDRELIEQAPEDVQVKAWFEASEAVAAVEAVRVRLEGLKKENLRDNMSTLELALNMLAEATTTELTMIQNPQGLQENRKTAREGGAVAGNARKDIESRTGRPVISSDNQKQLGEVVSGLLAEPMERDKNSNQS